MIKLYNKIKEKDQHIPYSLKELLSIKTIKDVVNFTGLSVSNGFGIKFLLQGDVEVKDIKI